MTFGYDQAHPHRLITVNGVSTGLSYDENGNRKGKPDQSYDFDVNDRVTRISAAVGATTHTATMAYDYGGRKAAQVSGTEVRRYFSEAAESRDGVLIKYFFLNGMRVASAENALWAQMTARRDAGVAESLLAAVTRQAPVAAQALALLSLLGLVMLPGPRRKSLGIVVCDGHVLLLVVITFGGALVAPAAVRQALAAGMGAGTFTPPAPVVVHFHLDRTGSTNVLTDGAGAAVQQVRYTPFGTVRYRSTSEGGYGSYRYEFTGYETEKHSGLEYAGARYYDPDLAMFLSHDPAGQFASPYSYAGWDPVNQVDPTGAFVASGGIDFSGGWSGGIGGASAPAPGDGYGGMTARGALLNFAVQAAEALVGAIPVVGPIVSVGLGAYGVYQSARSGDVVMAVVGGVALAGSAASAHDAWGQDSSFSGGTEGADSGGMVNDAQNPAAGLTAEPVLRPGDRGPATMLSEWIRDARARAIIAKYGGTIDAAASELRVDAGLIGGIIYEEQIHLLPGEALAERYGVGKTVGLGQVTEGLHGFTRAQLLDPVTNIRAIATHLSYLKQQSLIAPNAPLASLATRYNCGSCGSITPYGRRVVFYRSGL